MVVRMKFLLVAVNAKYIHSNPAVYSLRSYALSRELKEKERKATGSSATAPSAASAIFPEASSEIPSRAPSVMTAQATSCKQDLPDRKWEVEIAEYTINRHTDFFLSDLYKRRPDALAFSCYIWNWERIRRLLPELAKLLPGIPVWLGGPEVSFDAEPILKEYPSVTGVMVGEGEETFSALLAYYHKTAKNRPQACGADAGQENTQSELREIRGLVFREGARIVSTGEPMLMDPDRLPFYYADCHGTEPFKDRILYYESSRGCPYRCSYCLSSIDKQLRFRSLEKVFTELQFFLDRRVPQVKFIDRTFNCDRERAAAIWNYLLVHDNGFTNFHFETAAELFTQEQLRILSAMRPGLVQLEIGVQSANPRTLREIHRLGDLTALKETVTQILRGKNVHVHLDLIAGLPFEDYESFGRSFDTVYGLRPHQLQLGFLKVLKGSPMEKKAGAYGINYSSFPPYEVLYSRWLSYEEVCRLKRIEEMVELYYNSGQFTHTLPVLERAFDRPFALYEGLARFYEENGYFLENPSRQYRYHVLFAFACQYDKKRESLYRELLLFDLYLRENLKSRPKFHQDRAGRADTHTDTQTDAQTDTQTDAQTDTQTDGQTDTQTDGQTEEQVTGRQKGGTGEACAEAMKRRIRRFYEQEEKKRRLLPAYEGATSGQLARMTHLEPFTYQVWQEDGKAMENKAKEGAAVLFDYKERDPLTGAARVTVVEI